MIISLAAHAQDLDGVAGEKFLAAPKIRLFGRAARRNATPQSGMLK
jgi:hypothetical protein